MRSSAIASGVFRDRRPRGTSGHSRVGICDNLAVDFVIEPRPVLACAPPRGIPETIDKMLSKFGSIGSIVADRRGA
jgi:hypothetical protein